MPTDPEASRRPTLWQRAALRSVRRRAGKPGAEPLGEEDWAAVWALHGDFGPTAVRRLLALLPGSPRCSMCAAPFAGPGRFVVRPLGYRPSRKNPNLCETCVESSPPGGTTLLTGILFADLRGFTARSERLSPGETSALLRRFYGAAESVLFPEAIIDKVVGDEVMALYLPDLQRDRSPARIPALMLEHARALLAAVGYGSEAGPFAELGIGLDFGEAFVGNIGERAVFDFTAVGDVVNTASRLQGRSGGGEITYSGRVAAGLGPAPPGEPVRLELKGKSEPLDAHRVRVA